MTLDPRIPTNSLALIRVKATRALAALAALEQADRIAETTARGAADDLREDLRGILDLCGGATIVTGRSRGGGSGGPS